MQVTATFIPPKETFLPVDVSKGIAYQCNGQSNVKPERFLIYYMFFRDRDPNPSPEIVAKWKLTSLK